MVNRIREPRLRTLPYLLLFFLLPACNQTQWQQAGVDVLSQLNSAVTQGGPLTSVEIDRGLREALRIGSQRVVARVGKRDGFNGDPSIHIPLPEKLSEARHFARKFNLDKPFHEIEVKLNRAAEDAAPHAKALFWQAIKKMRLADVRNILDGPQDAATQYFKRTMSKELAQVMRPVIDKSLNDVGALRTYQRALNDYNALPFAPTIEADLSGYVLSKGMDGLFHYLAEEEAAIRRDPLKRSTELLKRVFGHP
mgnify:CR=1 FL=1